MKSVLFAIVILLAPCDSFVPLARADSRTRSGGPDELTGLIEKHCPDSKPQMATSHFAVCFIENGESAFQGPVTIANAVDVVTSPSLDEIACVAAAQKAYQKERKSYRACPGGEENRKTPCRSLEAITSMTRALTLVSECLNIDLRNLFRMASESTGLISGALPSSVEDAITTVRETEAGRLGGEAARDAAREIRKDNKSKPYCASLSKMDAEFALSDEKSACERITQSSGTYLPLYFQAKAFLFFRADIDAIRAEIEKKNSGSPVLEKFGGEEGYSTALRAIAPSVPIVGEAIAKSLFSAVMHLPFKGADEFLKIYRTQLIALIPASIRSKAEKSSAMPEEVSQRVKELLKGRECF